MHFKIFYFVFFIRILYKLETYLNNDYYLHYNCKWFIDIVTYFSNRTNLNSLFIWYRLLCTFFKEASYLLYEHDAYYSQVNFIYIVLDSVYSTCNINTGHPCQLQTKYFLPI